MQIMFGSRLMNLYLRQSITMETLLYLKSMMKQRRGLMTVSISTESLSFSAFFVAELRIILCSHYNKLSPDQFQFLQQMSLVVRKPTFAYAKTKTQISCAVTAQLISAFVFAT